MFHVKICGVRLKSDIDAVRRAGADAIGLNFYPKSIRYLDPSAPSTLDLSQYAKQQGLHRVGVFVNESAANIRTIVTADLIDRVQLHGDESLADATAIAVSPLPLLRAIKLPVGALTVPVIAAAVDPWVDAGYGVLLDADGGSAHGGSGQRLDWSSIGRWSNDRRQVDWGLAGGLRPDNVAEAIRTTHAKAVDVASGVESPRGQKSARLIEQFCLAASFS
ncbi:N-(5'-phosphoribosyl)anthranilate isomerase [Novipirellula artificiosorum]|uniref:N-(5'-phosphoribosyl)anthranilate isomerase n=1 Tax=Novipirellula artificiosorum TaxID=2528016 RepID=A0A5C6DWJ2_9BACT|nr:N-(5'-phosphoribosyl)anthranilate isomerase [Novipirellula artificiosorum]